MYVGKFEYKNFILLGILLHEFGLDIRQKQFVLHLTIQLC